MQLGMKGITLTYHLATIKDGIVFNDGRPFPSRSWLAHEAMPS